MIAVSNMKISAVLHFGMLMLLLLSLELAFIDGHLCSALPVS